MNPMDGSNTTAKAIYVILSATPTRTGALLRIFTGDPYNHSSISLTEDLREMYSFARYKASNMFVGGLVKEFPQRLSLGKERKVSVKIFKIPVSEKQYNDVKSFILTLWDDEERSIYNSLAVIGFPFGWGFDTYKAYTCSDFVMKALLAGDVIPESYKNVMVTPGQIGRILDRYLHYTGFLNDYAPASGIQFDTEDFFIKSGACREIAKTLGHFYNLIKRNIKARHGL